MYCMPECMRFREIPDIVDFVEERRVERREMRRADVGGYRASSAAL